MSTDKYCEGEFVCKWNVYSDASDIFVGVQEEMSDFE